MGGVWAKARPDVPSKSRAMTGARDFDFELMGLPLLKKRRFLSRCGMG
jgi:hypothetical protein